MEKDAFWLCGILAANMFSESSALALSLSMSLKNYKIMQAIDSVLGLAKFPKTSMFWIFLTIHKKTSVNVRFPKHLENSQKSKKSQEVSATMSGMEVPKIPAVNATFPKHRVVFVEFQKNPQNHQYMHDSQKTSRTLKIHKVLATMSGMELPKQPAVNATFPKNLEFYWNFQKLPNARFPKKTREFPKFTKSQQLCLKWKFPKKTQ